MRLEKPHDLSATYRYNFLYTRTCLTPSGTKAGIVCCTISSVAQQSATNPDHKVLSCWFVFPKNNKITSELSASLSAANFQKRQRNITIRSLHSPCATGTSETKLLRIWDPRPEPCAATRASTAIPAKTKAHSRATICWTSSVEGVNVSPTDPCGMP